MRLDRRLLIPITLAAGCLYGIDDLDDADRTAVGSAGGLYGYSASRFMGDIDWNEDLAIGAPTEDRVYIHKDAQIDLDGVLPVATAVTFEGDAGGEAGWSLTRGYLAGYTWVDDLVIGAPSEFGGRGRIYVLSGWSLGASDVELDADDAFTIIEGGASGEYLGWAVATGDVNGDGADDLIAGAAGWSGGRGSVYVFHGPLPYGTISVNDADVTLRGVEPGEFLGVALAAGDLDDSGTDEVIASALYGGEIGGNPDGRGRVYVAYDVADGEQNLEDAATIMHGVVSTQTFGRPPAGA
jgi:hypothetical protein